MFTPNEPQYDVRDLFPGNPVDPLGSTPGFKNAFTDGIDPSLLDGGAMGANIEQRAGVLYSNKTSFTDTTAGYRLGIDDSDGIMKFRVGDGTSYIYWDGTTLTIEGGLNVDEIHLPDQDSTANSFHVNTDGDAWWGATETDFNADNDNATAYVLKTGLAKFQNVTLDGTVVLGALSSGSLPSIQGWQFDGAFSASDSNTVAWGSGTLRFSNGETRSISGGNTGNMSQRTYIYYDEDASTTAFQTTTNASNAVGGKRILIATAEDGSGDEARFTVFGGRGDINVDGENIAARSITASLIAADTITANEIAVNTITATKMNVSQLSAITANMGTITAGTITLNSSGFIRGGQTAYDTGTGFFLGYSGGEYKFSVGKSGTDKKLIFDGNDLTASNMNIITTVIAGEDLSVGRVVYMGSGANEIQRNLQLSTDSTETLHDTNWCAQSFIATGHQLTSVTLSFNSIENGDTVTVRLRDSLTGSDIASDVFLSGQDWGNVLVTFSNFDTPLEVGKTYYLVVSCDDIDGGNETTLRGASSNNYSDGAAFTSVDSGSNWSSASTVADFYIRTTEYYTQMGRAYLATSIDGDAKMTSFIGITKESASKGDPVKVQIAGNYENYTNVIPGLTYFLTGLLSNPGAITTSAPSNQLRVGIGTPPIAVTAGVSHDQEETCAGADWCAQEITLPSNMEDISTILLWYKGAESGDTITVRIRNSLTGSDLYNSGAQTLDPSSGASNFLLNGVNLSVTGGGTYYIVISISNAGGATTPKILGGGTSEYSGGSASTSSDSGTSWGAASTVADFAVSVTSRSFLRLTFDLE